MTSVTDEEKINFIRNFKNVVKLCNINNNLDKILSRLKIVENTIDQESVISYMQIFRDFYDKYKSKILVEDYKDVILTVDDKDIKIGIALNQINDKNKKQLRARLIRCICLSQTEVDEDLKKLSEKFISTSNDKILEDVGESISEGLMKISSFKDLNKTGADGEEAFAKALKEVGNLTEDKKFMKNMSKVFEKAKSGEIQMQDITKQLIKEVYKLNNHSNKLNGKNVKMNTKKVEKMMKKMTQ